MTLFFLLLSKQQYDQSVSGKDSLRKPELVYCKPPENTVTNENMRVAVKGATRMEKKADAWEKSAMAKLRKR